MGRHQEFIVNQYFTYIKKTAECKLDGCRYTYAPKSGFNLHSKLLIDHMKRKHMEEYKAIDEAEEKQARKRELEESGHITNYSVGESSSKTPKPHMLR